MSKRYSISLFIMSHISSSLIWLFGQALLEFEVAGTQAMSAYGAHISGTSSSLVVHQSIPVPPFLFAPSFSQVYIYSVGCNTVFFENCWSSSFHMASWYTLIWVQLAKSHFLVLVLHYIQQTCYPTNYLNLCFKLHSTNIVCNPQYKTVFCTAIYTTC